MWDLLGIRLSNGFDLSPTTTTMFGLYRIPIGFKNSSYVDMESFNVSILSSSGAHRHIAMLRIHTLRYIKPAERYNIYTSKRSFPWYSGKAPWVISLGFYLNVITL